MLDPQRIGEGLHEAFINQRRGRDRFQLIDHPLKGNVGQAGFVFRIAPADVGVIACKPFLLQPLEGAPILLGIIAAVPPAYPREALSVFVDRERVPGVFSRWAVVDHSPMGSARRIK